MDTAAGGDLRLDRAAEVLGRLFDVRGARVVVTGAAGGLGFAMAEVLADCGARVTLADVDEERLEESTAQLLERGCDARAFAVDVTDEAGVQALFDHVVEEQDGVDVVFANAGLSRKAGPRIEGGQTLDTVQRSDWDAVLGVNQTGVMLTLRSAATVMKRQRSGRIIVTGSNAGLRPEPVVSYCYGASKAAVMHMVKLAALELAPYGVTVNAICPGPFQGTRLGGGILERPSEELRRLWAARIPLGRMADPEELKGLVLLLASSASSYMTGAAYVVDGGSLVQG